MAVKREFAALCNDEQYLESLITLLKLEQQNAPSMLTKKTTTTNNNDDDNIVQLENDNIVDQPSSPQREDALKIENEE